MKNRNWEGNGWHIRKKTKEKADFDSSKFHKNIKVLKFYQKLKVH